MIQKLLVIGFLFFCFGFQKANAQSYNFNTSGFSVLEKGANGKWGKWSDLELANIRVTLDTNKNRIVIYSQVIQLFQIIEYQPSTESETDIVYTFSCVDNDGVDCTVSIITRKKQDNRKQLYINYGDQIIVYNIFNAD
jgi:hypothetical protein